MKRLRRYIIWITIFIIVFGIMIGKKGEIKKKKDSNLVVKSEQATQIKGNKQIVNSTVQEIEEERQSEEKQNTGFLTENEEQKLKKYIWKIANQCKNFYEEIMNKKNEADIGDFVALNEEQRKEIVTYLGKLGVVSVSDNINMENYKEIEEFYSAFIRNDNKQVTIFEVGEEGSLRTSTFVSKEGKIQIYYLGITWKENAIPKLSEIIIENIEEVKLTEKGYFIYTYEESIAHGNLREYFRVKPLAEECRQLTKKYVSHLSFVNYNLLVTNWNKENIEEVISSYIFEDIYQMYTGERLMIEQEYIPSELYERIMTTCFPITKEQVRSLCDYNNEEDGYPHEFIFSRQYPPFGEVIDYIYNEDGSLELYVDAVWPDYNSDCAFTSRLVVYPFEDGTFQYLSNSVEKKELDIPIIKKE